MSHHKVKQVGAQIEPSPAQPQQDEIDLRELLALLWGARWMVMAVTGTFAVLSVALALWLPNQYKATVLLTPASTSSFSGLSQLASQFGGLASLAGVNIGADISDKSPIAMELIRSWGFQEKFIRDSHIEVEVFAAKSWNRRNNTLDIDPSIYDVNQKKWVRKFNPAKGETAEPSGWELYEKFSDMVSVSQDKKTGIVTLNVEYYSPELARRWAEGLVGAINRTMQEQDHAEAERSIDYLQKQIRETSLSEMRTVFYKLIEEQTKNLMLAEVSTEYVLKTLSPAKLPEEKSSPKRAIICVLGVLIGGLCAMFVVLYRHSNRSAKHQIQS